MGQRNSKSESLLGSSEGRDDGCIGNRKVRTVLLSGILITFFVMGMALFWKYHNTFDDPNVFYQAMCAIGGDSNCKRAKNSWILILVGAFVCIGSAALSILLFFVDCDNRLGRVGGVGLIVGGLFYIVGWFRWIVIFKEYIHYDDFSDKAQRDVGYQLAAWFGEALLPSGTAILLGCDVFMHMFDKESHRLFSNLGLLFIVSALCCPTYYNNSDLPDEDETLGLVESDSFAWIATGYAFIWWTALLYIVLYIFTCCTCDCKDTACARLIHAIGLLIGGVLVCIGYYYLAGDVSNTFIKDSNSELVTYYIGYTVLIGGVCLAQALDIGLDDVRS